MEFLKIQERRNCNDANKKISVHSIHAMRALFHRAGKIYFEAGMQKGRGRTIDFQTKNKVHVLFLR